MPWQPDCGLCVASTLEADVDDPRLELDVEFEVQLNEPAEADLELVEELLAGFVIEIGRLLLVEAEVGLPQEELVEFVADIDPLMLTERELDLIDVSLLEFVADVNLLM